MDIIKRKDYYYLAHSFRKDGRVIHREKYLGKELPKNLDAIKEAFLRECLQEAVFQKLYKIKQNFKKEWRGYPESIKKKILIDFSIDFTYNTNAIEGSTISHDETEDLIKQKIAPNKPLRDIQETLSHSKVFFKVFNEDKKLSLNLILKWHQELFSETKPDIAGELRTYLVKVGNYLAPDWQDVFNLMKEFIIWHQKNEKIMHPIELAARAHYKFEKIHPFGDGNGRVGRLIIVYVLKKYGYPMIIIEYKKRKSYYHALSKTENDFLTYFIRRYLKFHQKYLK